MITATQAKQLSEAFDVAAHHQKMHDSWLDSVESVIRSASKRGDTRIEWVPGVNPQDYPKEVHASVKAALLDAGYKIEMEHNIWNISWA